MLFYYLIGNPFKNVSLYLDYALNFYEAYISSFSLFRIHNFAKEIGILIMVSVWNLYKRILNM
jgi:hypothetical protein